MTKWGIIGSGKIARRFAADLRLVNDAALFGVTSRDPSNAAKFASEFGVTAFPSIADLLAANVDVVYVATPHPSHRDHAIAAINAGKAVLCEKPFALNSSETIEIIETARAQGVFVMEAMWTRFFPAIEEVVGRVKSGELGEIQSVESSFGFASQFDPRSRVFDPLLGGGSLLDVGVYSLALVRMLLDDAPARIECSAKLGSTGVDESANWKLTFACGATATGESSVVKALTNEARVVGSRGEIHIPKFWCPNQYSLNGEVRRFDFAGLGFQFEAQEVVDCLRRGLTESRRLPHRHTLDVMGVMDEIRGQWGLRYPNELSFRMSPTP